MKETELYFFKQIIFPSTWSCVFVFIQPTYNAIANLGVIDAYALKIHLL